MDIVVFILSQSDFDSDKDVEISLLKICNYLYRSKKSFDKVLLFTNMDVETKISQFTGMFNDFDLEITNIEDFTEGLPFPQRYPDLHEISFYATAAYEACDLFELSGNTTTELDSNQIDNIGITNKSLVTLALKYRVKRIFCMTEKRSDIPAIISAEVESFE